MPYIPGEKEAEIELPTGPNGLPMDYVRYLESLRQEY